MASPRTRGVSSLEEFATKLTSYRNLQSETQIRQLQEADKRFQRELIRASREAAGSDRVLSGVGAAVGFETRKGAPLGYNRVREGRMAIKFNKTGPWQFRDSTMGGGDTNGHWIGPRPDMNPRPLPPARKYRPTLRVRKGGGRAHFGGGSHPTGTFLGQGGAVFHPGSFRRPYWRDAVNRASVATVQVMRSEFLKVGRSVWP